MKKTIRVTKKYIREGVACSERLCPVALAIKDQTNLQVAVLFEAIAVYPGNGTVRYITSHNKVKKFVDAFDSGHQVRGFTFELDTEAIVPDPFDF